MNKIKPRVRFAPSPTGQLHLGGARTALFNYLYAKQYDGKFLLRIEDTDKKRSKQEHTNQICESIKWLSLDWDEEIIFQSQRTELYKKAVQTVLDKDKAYRCFCSKEELTKERESAEKSGMGYYYSGRCRNLSNNQIQENIGNGVQFSVRLRIPDGKTEFNDKIYGKISVNNSDIDDFIIARSDGTPTYNLVVAIDDNEMKITDIIRGEDHIANTSKQIIVYEALGLTIPEFAHLPMILGPDKKRLSKRHGATGVREYEEKGFLPKAMINYLALLGWNPGTEQEIFSFGELIDQFSIMRVQKKSAVFDEKKLQWISGQHIYKLSANKILDGIREYNPDWRINSYYLYIIMVIDLMKERVKTLTEMQTKSTYFFEDPVEFDEKTIRKQWKDNSVNDLLNKYIINLSTIVLWKTNAIEKALRNLAEAEGITPGKIIHPTRLAISGVSGGPSLFAMMALLGKNTCLRRLEHAIKNLP